MIVVDHTIPEGYILMTDTPKALCCGGLGEGSSWLHLQGCHLPLWVGASVASWIPVGRPRQQKPHLPHHWRQKSCLTGSETTAGRQRDCVVVLAAGQEEDLQNKTSFHYHQFPIPVSWGLCLKQLILRGKRIEQLINFIRPFYCLYIFIQMKSRYNHGNHISVYQYRSPRNFWTIYIIRTFFLGKSWNMKIDAYPQQDIFPGLQQSGVPVGKGTVPQECCYHYWDWIRGIASVQFPRRTRLLLLAWVRVVLLDQPEKIQKQHCCSGYKTENEGLYYGNCLLLKQNKNILSYSGIMKGERTKYRKVEQKW